MTWRKGSGRRKAMISKRHWLMATVEDDVVGPQQSIQFERYKQKSGSLLRRVQLQFRNPGTLRKRAASKYSWRIRSQGEQDIVKLWGILLLIWCLIWHLNSVFATSEDKPTFESTPAMHQTAGLDQPRTVPECRTSSGQNIDRDITSMPFSLSRYLLESLLR